jgi:branched-chain amino acid transport system ATP-binding protein
MKRPSSKPIWDVIVLELAQVSVQYGKRPVLREISLRLDQREVVSLLGANAAGKTTTLRSIMGLKALSSGSIRYAGEDITRLSTVERVRRGVTLAPEGRQVFSRFSVIDNLVMGGYHRADRNRLDDEMARVFDLFPQLAKRRKQMAGSLSGGEQQMLAIGRALMSHPRCLLLDEPTLGLAPIIVAEIERIVGALAADGMTILIAEQNAAVALEISHRAYVLEAGRIARGGSSESLKETAEMRRLYLGG